jgi:predicted transposase/invertase (TIGR01784 family)
MAHPAIIAGMKTDPICYRLFNISPETFFLLLGMPAATACEMAARYEFDAIEFKATAHRSDGVYRPKQPGLPLYVLEAQFYELPSIYADLLVKVYTYLKQHDPAQRYCGVVLFVTRALEPKELGPYQPLLDAGYVRRFYLDELPELPNAPVGMAILYLLRRSESEVPAQARELAARTITEIQDTALREDLLELIVTVVIAKLPKLSWKEIQAMLQLHDIHVSRAYQEAKAEGIEEGIAKERQRRHEEKRQMLSKMAAKQYPAEDIADVLGLDIEFVREQLRRDPS